MSNISVDFDVLNQRGSPAWFTDTFANIPTAGFVGRMFISKDTFAFYRDTGSGWDLIGGPGIGTLTGSGVVGQVSFFNGTQVITGNNNLFWDNVNSRLGINTTTPGAPLDIHATGTNAQFNGTGTNNAYLVFQNAGSNKWRIGNNYNGGANSFDLYNNTTTSTIFSVNSNGTFTLSTSLFANFGIALKDVSGVNSNGSLGLGSTGAGLSLGMNVTTTNYFVLPTSVGYSYTFPATTGTIALTSNLSSYVPYTGVTQSVDLGINDLSSRYLIANGNSTASGILALKISNTVTATSGYGTIGALSGQQFAFVSYLASNYDKIAYLNLSALSDSTPRVFTLPNATGTLALTSDITSAISGTTNRLAKFTSTNVIGNSMVSDDGTTLTSTGATRSNFYIKAANNSEYGQLAFTNGTNALSGGISYNNSSQYMQFETNTSEWMRLNSNGNFLIGTTTDNGNKLQVNGTGYFSGNVGIGVTTPSYKLDVAAPGSPSARVRNSDLGGTATLLLETANNFSGTCQTYVKCIGAVGSGVSDLAFGTAGASGDATAAEKMRISSAGVVTITNLGTGAVTSTAGVLSVTSDMYLKIEDGFIDNALEKILKLTPRYFYWKKESGLPIDLRQLGFYAQEVNQVLGEEVSNTPKKESDKWGIYDRGIIAMLTKAIQELNQKLINNNIN